MSLRIWVLWHLLILFKIFTLNKHLFDFYIVVNVITI